MTTAPTPANTALPMNITTQTITTVIMNTPVILNEVKDLTPSTSWTSNG